MSPKAALQVLATYPPDAGDSAEVSRAREVVAKSEGLAAENAARVAFDLQAREPLVSLELPEAVAVRLRELAEVAGQQRAKRRFNPRDPAMISVALGFLLLVGILTWHFLGRAGVFPEEALTIAAEGAKLRTEQFEVVDEKAGALEDWFVLKGFERFHIPPRFADYEAAGARVFKIENQPVAVLAIPENFMFFMVFDAVPLGIEIHPEGSWQFADFNYKYAAAIHEEAGMCFMVVIQGTKADVEALVKGAR